MNCSPETASKGNVTFLIDRTTLFVIARAPLGSQLRCCHRGVRKPGALQISKPGKVHRNRSRSCSAARAQTGFKRFGCERNRKKLNSRVKSPVQLQLSPQPLRIPLKWSRCTQSVCFTFTASGRVHVHVRVRIELVTVGSSSAQQSDFLVTFST